MITFLRILGGLVVAALVALLAIIYLPVRHTPPGQQLAADWTPAPGQGEYVAKMADCAACHTAPGGQPFAGGLAIASPMGTIYASNITPDAATGIGDWTLDQFRAALVDGVDDEGHRLYPAMPYENFRAMSEEDIRALYAYFTTEVPAVANEVTPTRLAFPFNQRWGIRLWDWVALAKPGFQPDAVAAADPQLQRGAYLVQALAHCGACHTPRTPFFSQDGLTADSAQFLTGGVLGNRPAPDLRGPDSAPQTWSADDLKALLTTGRNAHTSVSGDMALAVEDSLQYMTDADADAVVAYLRALNPKGGGSGSAETPVAVVVDRLDASTDATARKLAAGTDLTEGERLYMDNCAACHFTDGKGATEVFPPLAGNAIVQSGVTGGLLDTILYGAEMPSAAKRPERLRMPGFADRLSDQEVAELATFLRGAWGNTAGAVDAGAVASARVAGVPAN